MKKILFISVFILFAAYSFVNAQPRVPAFNQYAVKAELLKNIQVNLQSHRQARTYRTNLRNAAKEGVNFAGHYVIATWGCGTNCTESALIDGRNGRVYFPTELQGAGSGFCDIPDDRELLTYHANSRLLILSGFKGTDLETTNAPCGIYYVEWTGNGFRRLKFLPKKRFQ